MAEVFVFPTPAVRINTPRAVQFSVIITVLAHLTILAIWRYATESS